MTGRHGARTTIQVEVTELQRIRAGMTDMIRRNTQLCTANTELKAENERLQAEVERLRAEYKQLRKERSRQDEDDVRWV